MTLNPETIPADYEVQPIDPDDPPEGFSGSGSTCGTCGLSWDDGKVTSMTPTPAARCPFEAFHEDEPPLLDRVQALNRRRYTLTLTGGETTALRGMIADVPLSNPARRSVARKVAEANARHFKDREEAYDG